MGLFHGFEIQFDETNHSLDLIHTPTRVKRQKEENEGQLFQEVRQYCCCSFAWKGMHY